MKLLKPTNDEKVAILTQIQKDFLNGERYNGDMAVTDWLNLKMYDDDRSLPSPVVFSWLADGEVSLMISQTCDFKYFIEYIAKDSIEVYNLKIGIKYFWKIKKGTEETETFSFFIENISPRLIKIDGNTNVRDCGGWRTKSGEYTKQGLLFRGGEFNSHLTLLPSGRRSLEMLGIKTVIDLRGETEEVCDVYKKGYYNFPVKAYGEYITDDHLFNLELFELLADEKIYPAYIHCWGGADRTGTVIFLLNALLGVTPQNLVTDYEFTSLSKWGVRSHKSELFKSLEKELSFFGEGDYEKQTLNYFKSCCIEDSTIKKIKKIFL